MAGLLVASVADRWHGDVALEPSSDTVVNTLGLSPAGRNAFEAIRLESVEAGSLLLDDRDVLLCGTHLDYYFLVVMEGLWMS